MHWIDEVLANTAAACLGEMQKFVRGLRAFINEFTGTGITAIDQRLTAASAAVQRIHVLLTADRANPNGLSREQERALAAQDELWYRQSTHHAKTSYEVGDRQAALDLCNEVVSAIGSSLLTKCFARVLVAYNEGVRWDERLAAAERAVETLKASNPPPGRDVEQQQILQLGQAILNSLLAQTRTQVPVGGIAYV